MRTGLGREHDAKQYPGDRVGLQGLFGQSEAESDPDIRRRWDRSPLRLFVKNDEEPETEIGNKRSANPLSLFGDGERANSPEILSTDDRKPLSLFGSMPPENTIDAREDDLTGNMGTDSNLKGAWQVIMRVPRWVWAAVFTGIALGLFAVGKGFAPHPSNSPLEKPAQTSLISEKQDEEKQQSTNQKDTLLSRVLPNNSPQPTPLSQSEKTLTDSSIGLMWTKGDSGSDLTWEDAKDYCQKLQLGGHSNWRLPALNELQALYNEDSPSGDRASRLEWSSSPGNNPSFMTDFDFGTGLAGYGALGFRLAHVKCVRQFRGVRR
jgi:hypothetical protein